VSTLRVIGHRGARGLALENSLAAFDLALQLGVDAVEFDVVLTGDGKLAIYHDLEVPSAAGGQPIQAMSLAELRRSLSAYDERYNAPGSVPELRDLLELVRDHSSTMDLDLEVKAPRASTISVLRSTNRMLAQIFAELDSFHLPPHVSVLSFEPQVLRRIKRVRPDLPTALNYSRESTPARVRGPFGFGRKATAFDLAMSLGVRRIQPEWQLVREDLVTTAHRLGFEVVPWVVDSKEEIVEAIRLGVDGVCTDRPDIALAVRAEVSGNQPG